MSANPFRPGQDDNKKHRNWHEHNETKDQEKTMTLRQRKESTATHTNKAYEIVQSQQRPHVRQLRGQSRSLGKAERLSDIQRCRETGVLTQSKSPCQDLPWHTLPGPRPQGPLPRCTPKRIGEQRLIALRNGGHAFGALGLQEGKKTSSTVKLRRQS